MDILFIHFSLSRNLFLQPKLCIGVRLFPKILSLISQKKKSQNFDLKVTRFPPLPAMFCKIFRRAGKKKSNMLAPQKLQFYSFKILILLQLGNFFK